PRLNCLVKVQYLHSDLFDLKGCRASLPYFLSMVRVTPALTPIGWSSARTSQCRTQPADSNVDRCPRTRKGSSHGSPTIARIERTSKPWPAR
ncbi:hypothetical protein WG66_016143, partial [Moniliophthora roreri]